jgi:hypothetical protein
MFECIDKANFIMGQDISDSYGYTSTDSNVTMD